MRNGFTILAVIELVFTIIILWILGSIALLKWETNRIDAEFVELKHQTCITFKENSVDYLAKINAQCGKD